MDISFDYEDLFRTLNRHKVRYIVVGAYAVVYYTEPRFTKDLDIWVDPDMRNAERLYKALTKFGAPLKGIRPKNFTNKKLVYQIGVAPIRIDILMGLPGISFGLAWKNRARARYGGISISILGVKELMRAKKKTGRAQDSLDLDRLKRKNTI